MIALFILYIAHKGKFPIIASIKNLKYIFILSLALMISVYFRIYLVEL